MVCGVKGVCEGSVQGIARGSSSQLAHSHFLSFLLYRLFSLTISSGFFGKVTIDVQAICDCGCTGTTVSCYGYYT